MSAGGDKTRNVEALTTVDQSAAVEMLAIEAICLDEREAVGHARRRALAAVYFALLFDESHGLPVRELRAIGPRELDFVIEALQQHANGYALRGAREEKMAREYADVATSFRFRA